MSKILITGGTGFVGSHLVEAAQAVGHTLWVLVRKSSNTQHLEELGVCCLQAGLTDAVALEQVFKNLQAEQIQLDVVMHCAALTKAKSLDVFLQVNDRATTQLVDFLQQYQPQLSHFVFISSLAASGPQKLHQTITLADQDPITDYGRSKLAAEENLKKTTIPYTIFRPTAVYGPREKDIFTIFNLINKGLHPLIGRHRQQLTFIYVKDLVHLILKAIEKPALCDTFFVSDGKVYHKAMLGHQIEKNLSKQALQFTVPLWFVKGLAFCSQTFFAIRKKISPLNLEKYKELKAESWVCAVDKTFQTFDFYPAYDLEKGVRETTEWYLKEGWL